MMNLQLYFILTLFIHLAKFQLTKQNDIRQADRYDEELTFKPLSDGKLFAKFRFRTIYRSDFKTLRWENKMQIFPLSIAELVSATDLKKLHFSLTKGNWNDRKWGYSSRPAPPGAQIRVNFSQHSETRLKAWNRLINLLAGKFCTSLIEASSKSRATSSIVFRNERLENPALTSETFYANLPEETLCTENITPWKKLLPCQANSGLASLLKSENILKSSYSSLAIDLEPISCLDDKGLIIAGCEHVQLDLTFSVVFNPLLQMEGRQAWSLIKIFGQPLENTCQAAVTTKIRVDITDLDDINKLYPTNYESQTYELKDLDRSNITKTYAEYNLDHSDQSLTWPFNVGIKQKSIFKFKNNPSERIPIDLKTRIANYQGTHGTYVATITNELDKDVTITYMNIMPHFIKVYTHSLIIKCQRGNEQKNLDPLESVFKLSKDDEPTSIEITIVIPANDIVEIYYDFEGSFMRWTDYKPDANKGHLLSPASIRLTYCPSCLGHIVTPVLTPSNATTTGNEDNLIRIYARPLLLIQPTPDFSMPYNVICLVCTVLVAGFGPLHNITTRKLPPLVKKTEDDSKDKGE